MTAFGILTIVFYAVVIMIGYLICRRITTIIDNQQKIDSNLRKMDVGLDKWLDAIANLIENKLVAIVNDTHDTKVSARELTDIVDKMHRNLCVEIADKMVDRIYPDKESMNKIDWDKLSKEQQDEFLKRLIMPNYDNPFQPPFNPTCETTNNNE